MSVEKSGIKFSWHPFLGLFHPFVKSKHLETIRKLHRLALSQLDPLNNKKDQIDVLQTNANVKSKIIYQVHCFPPRNFLFLSVILAPWRTNPNGQVTAAAVSGVEPVRSSWLTFAREANNNETISTSPRTKSQIAPASLNGRQKLWLKGSLFEES